MLGAERTAEAQHNTKTGGKGAEVSPATGRLSASSALDAVNATERLLCGDGAVHGTAVAEGLAITGRRAATLLEPGHGPDRAAPGTAAAVPWVDHRLRPTTAGASTRAAFELVAADAQEAVDHCVVAHHLASALGRPGLCTIDRHTALGLSLVRLPDRGAAGPSSGVSPSSPDDLEATTSLPSDLVVKAAERSFAAVSKRLGRERGVITTHGASDARLMLIADGEQFHRAVAMSTVLRDAGVACGVVGVALVRPFPERVVRESIEDIELIAVVQPGSARDGHSELHAAVRAMVRDDERVIHRLPLGDDGEFRLSVELAEILDLPSDGPLPVPGSDDGPSAGNGLSFAFAPGGSYGDRVLLDLAALLGNLGQIELARPSTFPTRTARLVVANQLGREVDEGRVDLLFVAHPSAPGVLEGTRDLEALDERSSLILFTAGKTPGSAWRGLDDSQRRVIVARRPRLFWLSSSSLSFDETTSVEAAHWALQGALIAASPGIGELSGRSGDPIDALADLDSPAGPTDLETNWLRRGAKALRAFDLESIAAGSDEPEPTFQPGTDLPRMPAAVEDVPQETRDRWRLALRHFHLTGEGALSASDPIDAVPLRPDVLGAVARASDPWHRYPLVFLDGQKTESIIPLRELLDGAVQSASEGGSPLAMLDRFLPAIVRSADRVLERCTGRASVAEVLNQALERLEEGVDVSQAGSKALAEDVARFKKALPSFGSLLALDQQTLPTILLETFTAGRQSRRDSYREEIVGLLDRIDGLLQLDDSHSPEGRTPEALASTLATGGDFLDPAALSKNLPTHQGSKRMATARRARIEAATATLRDWLESSPEAPEVVLVRAPSPLEFEAPAGCRIVQHAEGLEAAIGVFDGLAEGMVATVQAVRIVRLEVDDRYDPERHDRVIERVDWQSFTTEEMFLLPAVVVLETGRRLRGSSLSSLSVLLRSGRPVQVVVSESTSELQWGESHDALAGYHPGLGYLAVAHREAFVLQSTLARPRHLIAGLQQMATMLNPAVALVAVPSWQSPVSPWLQLVAAQQSRTTPCFHYDPLAGETWAERFDLEDNPQVELPWPTHEVSFVDETGANATRDEAFTFAHAAAVDPAYGSHFRVIPPEAWADDQVEVAEYLARPPAEQRRQVPYLWVVTETGELARAVLTRELAFACRDRMRAWRILQELAGLHNEYARRAAEQATEQARADAERQRLEAEATHAEQVEQVRSGAAGEAMDRLVAVLMDLDSVPGAAVRMPSVAPPTPEAATAPSPEAAAEPAPVVEEEDEEDVSFTDPYINSVLCTTCDECTNLNPRMFVYNVDRQAVIADVTAGTFEQLVKAAEKCPARCIHPGAPRAGDATVTDELVARAKPFN